MQLNDAKRKYNRPIEDENTLINIPLGRMYIKTGDKQGIQPIPAMRRHRSRSP